MSRSQFELVPCRECDGEGEVLGKRQRPGELGHASELWQRSKCEPCLGTGKVPRRRTADEVESDRAADAYERGMEAGWP